MEFSINTNLSAFQVYDSLAKINSSTQKAQLRLATMKRINSVADDTSGFKVGTTLQGQNAVKKADLNNGSSALNYISTAESSLQLITEKLNQISAKYIDSQDPLKSKTSIAKDINALADEIDSILKNTKINGSNLLAQADGTALASNAVFGVGGDVTMDFASDSYLKVGDLSTILNGGTISVPSSDPSVGVVFGTQFDDTSVVVNSGSDTNSTFQVILGDDTTLSFTVPILSGATISDVINYFMNNCTSGDFHCGTTGDGLDMITGNLGLGDPGRMIKSIQTTSGFDIISYLGLEYGVSESTTSGGLRASDADTVLTAASDIATVTDNVKAALGRIGNLSQTLESRTEFLTSSISNNTALISKIFDADMAMEQLNATKGSIGSQVGVSMLLQVNTAPQQLLSLFR